MYPVIVATKDGKSVVQKAKCHCYMWGVGTMELEIEEVSRSYGTKVALKNISMKLSPGIYGLLGPNGAGKSTLIKLLTDNLGWQKGKILWDGKDILRRGKRYRNILGYKSQQQRLLSGYASGSISNIYGKTKRNEYQKRKWKNC